VIDPSLKVLLVDKPQIDDGYDSYKIIDEFIKLTQNYDVKQEYN
jgi:hypothetical protein